MSKPKAIVFDLGKVLLDFDYEIASSKIAAAGKTSSAKVREFIDHSPLLRRLETGLMTSAEFHDQVCRETGYRGDFTEFSAVFADIFKPMPEMISLQATLKSRGLPTFIFSNTNDIAVAHIKRSYPFFANFDGYVYSYQHRVMKPDAGLYEEVERITGHKGADILYLDDRAENVAAGAARGWQVILQETPEKSIAAVRKLGLL